VETPEDPRHVVSDGGGDPSMKSGRGEGILPNVKQAYRNIGKVGNFSTHVCRKFIACEQLFAESLQDRSSMQKNLQHW